MTEPLDFLFGAHRTEVVFQDELDPAVLPSSSPPPAVVVFDKTTFGLFGAGIGEGGSVVLEPGETSKTWPCAEAILRRCVERGLGRDGTVTGVGGGVVCDLAAFAASLYMRGCVLVLVPTTLLAMADASLGGKAAIDFAGLKNLIGTFYPAARIHIIPSLLKSLPGREYLSGLAEVIKTAMIGDPALLATLRDRHAEIIGRDPGIVSSALRSCLVVKGRIVASDFTEEGPRAVLNLGHTFGHALESVTGFAGWTHGEAVAWGIGRALEAGLAAGVTDPGYARYARGLLEAYGYRLRAEVDPGDLVRAMTMDKKKRSGRIRLVLPVAPGQVTVREAEEGHVLEVLSR